MTTFQALLLGLVQGITEFLPISSSGHLKLIETLLGLKNTEALMGFDLCCHFGTLIATLIVLRKEVFSLFTKKRKTLLMLIIAILPLIPIYFLLKGPIESLFGKPEWLWLAFFMTASLLALAHKLSIKESSSWPQNESKRQALAIGCFQAMALMPGLSRSGSTITAARLFGWKLSEAVRFSYLLAMPTIFGGMILETKKMVKVASLSTISPVHYLIGFTISFMVGIMTLKWFLRFVEKGKLHLFAFYCLGMSILSFFLFNPFA